MIDIIYHHHTYFVLILSVLSMLKLHFGDEPPGNEFIARNKEDYLGHQRTPDTYIHVPYMHSSDDSSFGDKYM